MSKKLIREGFWGTPEKLRKLLEQDLVPLPKLFFMKTISRENFEKIASQGSGVKVVFMTTFP